MASLVTVILIELRLIGLVDSVGRKFGSFDWYPDERKKY
jgi:hypothetical protein